MLRGSVAKPRRSPRVRKQFNPNVSFNGTAYLRQPSKASAKEVAGASKKQAGAQPATESFLGAIYASLVTRIASLLKLRATATKKAGRRPAAKKALKKKAKKQ